MRYQVIVELGLCKYYQAVSSEVISEEDWLILMLTVITTFQLPYFFGYKTEFFSFQNNPKDLDPSCKMDLVLWDCLGRVKLVL